MRCHNKVQRYLRLAQIETDPDRQRYFSLKAKEALSSQHGNRSRSTSYTASQILDGAAGVEWRDALRAGIDAGVISATKATGTRKLEVRNCVGEVRAEMIGGGKKIVGYAAVFNQLSEPLRVGKRTVRERVMPGAFNRSLAVGADIRALLNHDPNYVLGRVKSRTLRVSVDSHGLRYEVDPGSQTYVRDLMESLDRGDIDQSSFGFYTVDDAYLPGDDGMMIRELRDVSVFDVSCVVFPAYTGSSSGVMN